MHVLITGAAGMIGRKLTERLLAEPELGGRPVTKLTRHDVVTPQAASAPRVAPLAAPTPQTSILPIVGDISDKVLVEHLIAEKPDLIVHLAAVVSGEAEADFAKGYAVNLDGTRLLFDEIRKAHYGARVLYASSIAVFGVPFPDSIPDDFHLTPLTSYGTQKAVGEFILADYSRRGFFDGIGIRLPTVCVRPGAANKAASGFFSNIIREPLKGEEAILPVPDTVRHWFASPRAAVGFFLHAAGLSTEDIGPRRNLTMPGLPVSVAEQIAALRAVAGDKAAALIKAEPDETISRIVSGWPQTFDASRAGNLGFVADDSFEAIIRSHIEDEHGGTAPVQE
jgi:UDP-glucose 4-epimerase